RGPALGSLPATVVGSGFPGLPVGPSRPIGGGTLGGESGGCDATLVWTVQGRRPVIFSIFGKREKARRREADTTTQRGNPSTATAATTAVNQREIARRTAEKIDLIESQMD